MLKRACDDGDLLECGDFVHRVRKSRNFVCAGEYRGDVEPYLPVPRPSNHRYPERVFDDEDWGLVRAGIPFRVLSGMTARGNQQTGNAGESECLSLSGRLLSEDTGGSMIELLLSSTVMLAVLLCILEVCLVLYAYCCTAMAAREGTRYAIVRGSACNSFAAQCPAAKSDITNYIQGLQFPAVNAAAFGVTTTYSAYPSGTCSPSASCNNPGNLVKIQVTYSYPLSLPMVSKITFSLSSTSQMIISQ
jgi:hypothetical protein